MTAIALITGASGGIGSAIARGLAEHGARLALSGSNEAKLKEFAGTLGGDHVTLACDLSDPSISFDSSWWDPIGTL